MDNVENPWENPFSLQSGYNYGLHTVPYIRCTKEIGSAPPSVSGGAPCGPGLLHLLRQPAGNHLGPPKTAARFWGPNYFMDHVGGVNPPTLRRTRAVWPRSLTPSPTAGGKSPGPSQNRRAVLGPQLFYGSRGRSESAHAPAHSRRVAQVSYTFSDSRREITWATLTPEAPACASPRVMPAPSPMANMPGSRVSNSGLRVSREE